VEYDNKKHEEKSRNMNTKTLKKPTENSEYVNNLNSAMKNHGFLKQSDTKVKIGAIM